MVDAYKKAVRSLWTGRCTVTVKTYATDEETGREKPTDFQLYTDLPCRISYDGGAPAEIADGAARTDQSITLFIGIEYDIPEGSCITVTQNGRTERYKRSGTPAVYFAHLEIPLELYEERT